MGNHAHLLIVIKDSIQAREFYGQVKKRITDSVKKLLGIESLELWESGDSVIHILDADAVVKRLV